MKDSLQHIISSIVDYPKDVRIDEEQSEGIKNFIINANNEDIGKIIGKGGKIIRSIRNLMRIQAIKEGARINITIADSEKK